MSNNRYVILNCPALQQTYYCNTHHSKCQDCTDCTTKKIIEKCKEIIKEANNNSLYKSEYGDIVYFEQQGMKKLAEHILDLYDIQEI